MKQEHTLGKAGLGTGGGDARSASDAPPTLKDAGETGFSWRGACVGEFVPYPEDDADSRIFLVDLDT